MVNLLRTADMRIQKKRKNQGEAMRKSTLILGSACIAMTAADVLIWQTEDREGPEIIFEEKNPVYRQGMDTEELLNDVYAEVSSSLRIESVYLTENGKHAIVVYAAKDSQNHVTRKRRTISCVTQETDIENSTVTAVESLEEMEPQRLRLYLSIYEVFLQSGAVFDSLQYVERIEDDTDSEGNQSNTAVLTVHVAEMA